MDWKWLKVCDGCCVSVQTNTNDLWRWFTSIRWTMNGIDEHTSDVECVLHGGVIWKLRVDSFVEEDITSRFRKSFVRSLQQISFYFAWESVTIVHRNDLYCKRDWKGMVDGCAGVQTMRMKRVGGYKPYEEQPKREGYVDKGESVESALKISEMWIHPGVTGEKWDRMFCVWLIVSGLGLLCWRDRSDWNVCVNGYVSVQNNKNEWWRRFNSIRWTMNGIDECWNKEHEGVSSMRTHLHERYLDGIEVYCVWRIFVRGCMSCCWNESDWKYVKDVVWVFRTVQNNKDDLWRWFKSIRWTINGIDEHPSDVECALHIGAIWKWEWIVL